MATNQALQLGGFTGKQMKAIMGFCDKKNALSALYTPFFYGGKLFATNSCIALVMDANARQNQAISQDKAWSLPSSVVEKCLVKDAFYPTVPEGDTPVWAKLGTGVAEVLNDNTERLAKVAKVLVELTERDVNVSAPPQWVDPTFLKKIAELADAFNVNSMAFETVSYRQNDYFIRVKFFDRDDMAVILMPKKMA